MEGQVKKTMVVLMLVFFVMAVATELVSASQAKTDHIKYMKADFSARPISGHAPLTVHFTDHSKSHSKVLNWSWNFGDKKTSSLQNPTQYIGTPGNTQLA